jgi:5-methylcytosine-specific restriction endonuclease McrA
LSAFHREFEAARFDWIRTVRLDLAAPRIIRVLTYNRVPKQPVKLNRRNIFARDSHRCQYCGKKPITSELSLDHIIPRSQSGPTTWDNIVTCCVKCNVRKGGRTPEKARMTLLSKPVKPATSPVLSIRLSDHKYRSWRQFLNHAYWNVELR